MKEKVYRDCNFHGLECTPDGEFRRLLDGKYIPRKVFKRQHENGRKQTAYVRVNVDGKSLYHAANTLVAYAWCRGYEEGDYILHKDGNLHNIEASNLVVCGKRAYTENRMQNVVGKNKVSLQDRLTKLKAIHADVEATICLFENDDWTKVHNRVEKYLVNCLMDYGTRTIHLSKNTTATQVPEIIARLYECLDKGYCVYNYERWCKQMLLTYKKTGTFGGKANAPSVNIRQIVRKDDITKLCEHFNVKQNK